ncbi:hypothetical protein JHK85_036204 [Glycine max]|nr:hypothetical protein JHK85_036204 [Glycine max]
MDALRQRAVFVKESLHKSQTITDNMVSILGSFDHRLSALETAMRPTQAEAKILRGPHEDLESYLEAIDQLRANVRFFSSNKSFKSSEGIINHANNLLAKAMTKLEEEFKHLLTNYSCEMHKGTLETRTRWGDNVVSQFQKKEYFDFSKPVEPDRLFECLPNSLRPSNSGKQSEGGGKNHSEKQSSETVTFALPILIPPRVIPLLHDLAQQMVQAGHQQQLFRIYRDTRATVLEQSLRKLGVERLSKDDVQKMQWEVLEAKIGNWIHYMRIAVKLLISGEKKICDQIFDSVDSLKAQCFAEVTASSVAMLLSFGEAIAKSKRSPEKLFVLLDMYEIMRELQPEIERLFESKACIEMRDAAMNLTKRLAQTAQETFIDFEEAVEKDATKTTVMDGTVHPLTSYVINYVKFLYE